MRISDWSSDVCSSDLLTGIDRCSLEEQRDGILGICFVNLIVGVTVLIISASNPAEPRCGVVGKAKFLGECPDVAALEKIVDFLCSAINVKNDGLSEPNIGGQRCQGERAGKIKISAQCDMIKIATTDRKSTRLNSSH